MWIGSNTDIEDVRQAEKSARERSALAGKGRFSRRALARAAHPAHAGADDRRRAPRRRALCRATCANKSAMIERNIALEARLIDDLLDLTRIAHGKLQLRLADLRRALAPRLAVEIVRDERAGKEVALELDLAAERTGRPGRSGPPSAGVLEPAQNAVKFTPGDGTSKIRTCDRDGRRRARGAGQRHRHPAGGDRAHFPAL